MIKVQCISYTNEVNQINELVIGKWYDADFFQHEQYIIYGSGNKEYSSNFGKKIYNGFYPKKFFVTLSEKREIELNKILNK